MATKQVADQLYEDLKKLNIEVIYDDRKEIRAGQMFADADLLGVPIRVLVSPRNLKENQIEISTRDKKVNICVDVTEATNSIVDLKSRLYAEI